jgi:hypothetical protein
MVVLWRALLYEGNIKEQSGDVLAELVIFQSWMILENVDMLCFIGLM